MEKRKKLNQGNGDGCKNWDKKEIMISEQSLDFTPKVFCECCGMQLRASPHCGRVYREKVRAKKNELIENVIRK
jgi:hypothetical protein